MADKEDHLDIWVKISQQIGELNGFIKTALDKLADHEKRIDDLEKGKGGVKDNIVKWLVMALIGSIGVIATLTGSTAIIKTMLGAA